MTQSLTGLLSLMLASASPGEATAIEPPNEPLVCRYESVVSRFLVRRKLCLTSSAWAERDRDTSEAARRSIYELMGNTACQDGGICTSE